MKNKFKKLLDADQRKELHVKVLKKKGIIKKLRLLVAEDEMLEQKLRRYMSAFFANKNVTVDDVSDAVLVTKLIKIDHELVDLVLNEKDKE